MLKNRNRKVQRTREPVGRSEDVDGLSAAAFAGLLTAGFVMVVGCALVGGRAGLAGVVLTVVVVAGCVVSRG
ncbi:hypothetical protein [Streptomyces sp. NPDC019507]|uniref:hypothetical protein n=1 Tax=Streptomyces sp. NPDC019507 TaxID=3154689 RepID=UPI0033FCDF55